MHVIVCARAHTHTHTYTHTCTCIQTAALPEHLVGDLLVLFVEGGSEVFVQAVSHVERAGEQFEQVAHVFQRSLLFGETLDVVVQEP